MNKHSIACLVTCQAILSLLSACLAQTTSPTPANKLDTCITIPFWYRGDAVRPTPVPSPFRIITKKQSYNQSFSDFQNNNFTGSESYFARVLEAIITNDLASYRPLISKNTDVDPEKQLNLFRRILENTETPHVRTRYSTNLLDYYVVTNPKSQTKGFLVIPIYKLNGKYVLNASHVLSTQGQFLNAIVMASSDNVTGYQPVNLTEEDLIISFYPKEVSGEDSRLDISISGKEVDFLAYTKDDIAEREIPVALPDSVKDMLRFYTNALRVLEERGTQDFIDLWSNQSQRGMTNLLGKKRAEMVKEFYLRDRHVIFLAYSSKSPLSMIATQKRPEFDASRTTYFEFVYQQEDGDYCLLNLNDAVGMLMQHPSFLKTFNESIAQR